MKYLSLYLFTILLNGYLSQMILVTKIEKILKSYKQIFF